jgi:hypothetical protein
MYGPNYVKLSRLFAVQLFSMFIGHYATLPPVRSDPHWPAPQPCHHRLHSPRPHPYTATHAVRDSNLGSGNHDMSRLSTLAYLNNAPIHTASPIYLYAYFQRVLGVYGTLAPRSRRDTTTPTARDSNLGSGNQDMSRLSTPAYLNDAPIHGLTAIYHYAYFQQILGVAPSPLAPRPHTSTPAARDSNLDSGWQPRHV